MDQNSVAEKERLADDVDTVAEKQKPADDDDTLSEGSVDSRGKWGNQVEFTLSCIGYSVGLGNLWRFPYLCMRNGGGAFLIPYFLFLFLCGLPLFYLELCVGQFSSLSPLSVWKLCPLFKGIGWGTIILTGIMTLYYNVIITWIIYYLGMSLRAVVPWSTCDNPWNTPSCRHLGNMSSDVNFTIGALPDNVTALPGMDNASLSIPNKTMTAAEEFWVFKVLNISSGIEELGELKWDLLLCLIVAWVVVYLCLCKGIKSSGKVVYVTATIPYLFLTILLIRGVTLPGSWTGIKYYIMPDWKRLLEFKVWSEACIQIFYSLGPCWGSLITFASYNNFHNNCLRDSVIVCLACSGTSFYAGFAIFSIIGFMASQSGLPVEEVITQGPGLAFVAYPEALARLPISPFWAVCFFLMLFSVGLDSQFGMLETVISGFVDQFPNFLRKRKTVFVVLVCLGMLLLNFLLVTQGGMYIFQLTDWYVGAITLFIIGISECLIVSYIYGIGRFFCDINIMLGSRPSYIWIPFWCIITPGILLVMLVVTCLDFSPPAYGDYQYPVWAIAIGWMIASVSTVPIFLIAIYEITKTKGSLSQRIATLLNPAADWGPADEKHRSKYLYTLKDNTWKNRVKVTYLTHIDSDKLDHQVPEGINLNSSEKQQNFV